MKAQRNGSVHIIGAGLAGLAAAVLLAKEGQRVQLHEASPHAGGRCRSYFDTELGCRIDNGNHLLLAGNEAALEYLEKTGGSGTLDGPPTAGFPFIDAASEQRWTVQPNRGALPWWVLCADRRVPQTRATDYLGGTLALRQADASATVAAVLDPTRILFRRLWEPLAVAALNTSASEASAALFWEILRETLGRGGGACRPLVPRVGLSETFVEPALARLRAWGAEIQFGARLKALTFGPHRVSDLLFDAGSIELGSDDRVILAVPAVIAARLVPTLTVPTLCSPIVNAHFRCDPPPDSPWFCGVVGGAAEWIFRKRGMLSVTVSAADRMVDRPAPELRDLFWRDAAMVYRLPHLPTPPARIVKERRATFLASPDQLRRRPKPVTEWKNLLLAGDYVDTGLPATIEGAIRSGFAAARLLIDDPSLRPSRIAAGRRRSHITLPTEVEQEQDHVLP